MSDLTELENRIRSALHDRARSLDSHTHATPWSDSPGSPTVARSQHRGRIVVAALVATSALALVTVWRSSPWASVTKVRTSAPTQRSDHPPSVSSSTVAPPKDAGEEVPIARTAPSQAQVDEWFHFSYQQVPGTPVIAVQTPGRPVITVVTKVNSADGPSGVQARCAFFDPSDEQPPQSPWAGLRGTCFPMTHIAETLLLVEENLPSSPIVSYGSYVWTEVPHGAAYVTFEAGVTRAWQRPLDGVVDFPLAGDGSAHLNLAVVVRAFDENGQQLAESHAAP